MLILNLGSGAKVCDDPSVVNIDWSPYLRLKRNPLARRVAPFVLNGERRDRLLQMDSSNVLVHDLRKGIPFDDESADVVYHSHLLEHIDRDQAEVFMAEVRRVLKIGGVQRIVVPDLERACRQYIDHLDEVKATDPGDRGHDAYVAEIIEQSVRRENFSRASQSKWYGRFESLVLGDARRRGETHQWMYDDVNLADLLVRTGFDDISRVTHRTTTVAGWPCGNLDLDNKMSDEHHPGSLYMEARRTR